MSYINENSFSRWIIEKSDSLTTLGLQKLSETVRNYAYLLLTSQTSTRGSIIGHAARNLDAQRVFLNTFEKNINRRVDIPEDIRRFHMTLQYARSKVTGEFTNMLPSDIGKIKNYNNKLLISPSSFSIGTNLKINLDDDKHIENDRPGLKSKKKQKQDIKVIKTKPDIKSKKEDK